MILGIDARLANEAQPAGVGRYTSELLRALSRRQDNCTLRLYLDAPPNADFPLPPDGADMRVLGHGRFWTQRVLGRELRANPPDVFFSPLMQLPLRIPCPAIATVHDLAFLRFPGEFTRQRRWKAKLQAWQVVRQADWLLADSEATRDDVARFYPNCASRISVAHLAAGADYAPGIPHVQQEKVLKRLEIERPYLLYVGRLQPRKNLVRLIEAFGALSAKRPNLPHALVLAGGSGGQETEIRRAVQESPVQERIRLLGYVAEGDLPPLMAAADAVALVSLWEGFGLPALEALQCGTPVLVSNCSSLPEVAGDAAEYVDPADSASIEAGLEHLLCDASHRAVLAARSGTGGAFLLGGNRKRSAAPRAAAGFRKMTRR